MNIYLVSRTDKWSWDDFDSLIVAAKSEEDARNTHPYYDYNRTEYEQRDWDESSNWVKKEDKHTLKITLIGKTTKEYKQREVLLASFNAG